MPKTIHLQVIFGFAVLVWAATLLFSGTPVTAAYIQPFNTVVGASALGLMVFDRWLWRWRRLHGWFVNRPDLNGTWRVRFASDWVDASGNRVPAKIAYMAVEQTFTKLSMRLLTDESTSKLVADAIVQESDGRFRVFAVYQNESRMAVRDRSPIHYGGFALNVQGDPAEALEGSYWTDRKTRGEMQLSGRRKKRFDSFEKAKSAFRDGNRQPVTEQQARESIGAGRS